MKKSFWLLMVLAILVVVFSVQNADAVPFSLFLWKGEVSLAILLISSFIFGALFGALYYAISFRKKKKHQENNVAGDVAFETKEERINEE
ncbi:LapA family protein [Labilibacter sediminis]|nr:LapA family protein [Labilibacter sediminis]